MRYEYRSLIVTHHDKHEKPDKRRGGDSPDRYLSVFDTGRGDLVQIPDEQGDNLGSFNRRARCTFTNYLNELGDAGWKVISHTPSTSPQRVNSWFLDYAPGGVYLLMRERSEKPTADAMRTSKSIDSDPTKGQPG